MTKKKTKETLTMARRKAVLSQHELAKILGVNQATVSRIENGISPMSAITFNAFCDAVNLTKRQLAIGHDKQLDLYWAEC